MAESDGALVCGDLVEAAAEALGGEATPGRLEALRLHLARCPACAASFEGLEAALAAARSLDVPEPGPAYWAAYLPELRRRIEARPRFDPSRLVASLLALLRPAAAAAALAALSGLVLVGGDRAGIQRDRIASGPEELSAAELAAVHELSLGLDDLEAEAPIAVDPDQIAAALAVVETNGHEASGDLLGFLGVTEGLSESDTRALLAAMGSETEG